MVKKLQERAKIVKIFMPPQACLDVLSIVQTTLDNDKTRSQIVILLNSFDFRSFYGVLKLAREKELKWLDNAATEQVFIY